jgi:hypothetical protein
LKILNCRKNKDYAIDETTWKYTKFFIQNI